MRLATALAALTLATVAQAQPAKPRKLTELQEASVNYVATRARLAKKYMDLGVKEKDMIAKSLETVREAMRDPEGARVRNVELLDFRGGKVVCGEINPKNGYGAYVGYMPFVATYDSYEMWDARDDPTRRDSHYGVLVACAPK